MRTLIFQAEGTAEDIKDNVDIYGTVLELQHGPYALCAQGLVEAGFIDDMVTKVRVQLSKTYQQGFRKVTPTEDGLYTSTIALMVKGEQCEFEVSEETWILLNKFNRGNPVFVKVTPLERLVINSKVDAYGEYESAELVKIKNRKRTEADRIRDRRRRRNARIERNANRILDAMTA